MSNEKKIRTSDGSTHSNAAVDKMISDLEGLQKLQSMQQTLIRSVLVELKKLKK